jgi:hypothetical protein
MKRVRSWLAEADPFRAEGSLSADDARAMRQRILAEYPAQRHVHRPWVPGPMIAMTALAASLLIGIGLGRIMPRETRAVLATPTSGGNRPAVSGETQVRFTTPGGTQIVWVLNAHFEL